MTKEEFQTKLKEILETKGSEWFSVGGTIEKIGISMADLKTLYNAKNSKEVFCQIPFVEVDEIGNQLKLKTENECIDMHLAPAAKKSSAASSAKLGLASLLESLKSDLYEKDETMRLCLLACLAGESVFMLGPPGTAKSMISRKICNAVSSKEKHFEYLMSQFSTPDEIFGPVSLKALENDEYKRITDRFLPTAEVAFLDEIWKAGPAIQNTLLTILNEKKFHNGKDVLDVPLKAFFAASNELPAKNCGLEALFDRFLIRTVVNPIANEENFDKLFTEQKALNTNSPASPAFPIAEYQKGGKYENAINTVTISDHILSVIHSIKQEIQQQNDELKAKNEQSDKKEELFYVSDRRWKKIAHLLKTSAFANGRKAVDLMDLQLITHCIWSTQKQRELADEIVLKCIKQNGLEYSANIEGIGEDIEHFEKTVYERFFKCKKAEKTETEYDGETFVKIEYERNNLWISESRIYSEDFGNSERVYNFNKTKTKVTWCTKSDSHYWDNPSYKITAKLILQKGDKYEKNTERFDSDDTYNLLKEASDIKNNEILESINKELQKLSAFESKNGAAFKQNLFANQKCYDVIMSKITDEKENLENLKVKLDKVKARYAK